MADSSEHQNGRSSMNGSKSNHQTKPTTLYDKYQSTLSLPASSDPEKSNKFKYFRNLVQKNRMPAAQIDTQLSNTGQKEDDEPAAASTNGGMGIQTQNSLGVGSSSHKKKYFPKNYEYPPKVRGFERDEMSLEIMLLEGGGNGSFKTIGVFGLPGVGKTTLCRFILKNERVKESYGQMIWVSLSETETEKPKTEEEHNSDKAEEHNSDEVEELNSDVYKLPELLQGFNEKLKEKKYLIVVDDVGEREGDEESYAVLKTCFDELPKEKGGAVIVISRSEEIAEKVMVEEKNFHRLMPLTDLGSCWLIYKDAVKGSKQREDYALPSDDVMEELMKKCGGLPGAAQLLGKIKGAKIIFNIRSAVKATVFIRKLQKLSQQQRQQRRRR
ncbi:Disease resistance protein [Corchorus capsularis]|uniref:Disease resistance protein n=1 Tax=Corchorus capsularis TaxID=210143 RepID=A0A1R3GNE6_COCAP|nr:Disease resistance protein [Corchorus capsularis]